MITKQLSKGLLDIKSNNKLVVAYEPIWAIGTGKAATGKQANEIIKLIRNTLTRIWGENTSRDIRILYGGSVSGVNIAEFIGEPDIDGALVGGASLKPDDFVDIVRKTSAIKLAAR